MPRKNARPAARKAHGKKRAKKQAVKPTRVISLAHRSGSSELLLAQMIINAMREREGKE